MSATAIQKLYQEALRTPSDVSEHLPTLYRLARECRHVTEFGTRGGCSTLAFLAAQPEILVCYDLLRQPAMDVIAAAAHAAGRPHFRFVTADVLHVAIEPTDLLFIDTLHVYEQTLRELALHAEKAGKYLAFHDTTTYGEHGEIPGTRGIWPAITEFLDAHPHWTIRERAGNNNGLTVLSRQETPRPSRIVSTRPAAGISGCIVARNARERIEAALQSLQGWTDQIIVIDRTSEDATVAIARRYTECILIAPRDTGLGALRNLAIPLATNPWLFFLDADERVPERLGSILRQLLQDRPGEFEALSLPVKPRFLRRWVGNGRGAPGYQGPQLLKIGQFEFDDSVPPVACVNGRTLHFPADDPDLAIDRDPAESLHPTLPAVAGIGFEPRAAFQVVIPSARAANLVPCVQALMEHEPSLSPQDIIVVDDGARELAEDALPGIRWVAGVKPFVFARNANRGTREAQSDVLLLNDDARLLTPSGLAHLARVAWQVPEIGLCSPGIQGAVGNPNQRATGRGELREERERLTFVCVYIPRSTLDQIGLLDERFAGYGYDDDDYCARVLAAGLRLVVWDGCVFEHGVTLPSTFRSQPDFEACFADNRQRFEEKWGRPAVGER